MKELGQSSWEVFQKRYAHVLNARPRWGVVTYKETAIIDLDATRKRRAEASL